MTQVVYILITTVYGQEREVAEDLMKYEEVEDAHILYGQFDLIIKLQARDMKTIEQFIFDRIRSNKDIESTETLIAADVSSSEKGED